MKVFRNIILVACSLNATTGFADAFKRLQAKLGRTETCQPAKVICPIPEPVEPVEPTLVPETNPGPVWLVLRGGLIKSWIDAGIEEKARKANLNAQDSYERDKRIYKYEKAEHARLSAPKARKTDYEALNVVRAILADHHIWEKIEDDRWKIYLITLCAHNGYKYLAPEDSKVSEDFLGLIARTIEFKPQVGDDEYELVDEIRQEVASEVFVRSKENRFVTGGLIRRIVLRMENYSSDEEFKIFMDELNAKANAEYDR